ncbi:MAG: CcoQ/FixQ family Cbb3-type cytochrome c oxidase assembly chaperone [Chitinophagaceae bacterium]|nr:CcoQ/FixQ family Cbb3-type cytochrome c oxidase assembly chaperone [Chitinophagaceae bacterium]
MKFKHYLSSIDGVSIYPMISLLFFFAFFVGLLVFVAKADKKYIQELENLPFENE